MSSANGNGPRRVEKDLVAPWAQFGVQPAGEVIVAAADVQARLPGRREIGARQPLVLAADRAYRVGRPRLQPHPGAARGLVQPRRLQPTPRRGLDAHDGRPADRSRPGQQREGHQVSKPPQAQVPGECLPIDLPRVVRASRLQALERERSGVRGDDVSTDAGPSLAARVAPMAFAFQQEVTALTAAPKITRHARAVLPPCHGDRPGDLHEAGRQPKPEGQVVILQVDGRRREPAALVKTSRRTAIIPAPITNWRGQVEK